MNTSAFCISNNQPKTTDIFWALTNVSTNMLNTFWHLSRIHGNDLMEMNPYLDL